MYYSNNEDAKIWQKLWRSKIHYRLKVTLRHFAYEIMPTRERIQNFANLVDISCPLCFVDIETDLHVMAHFDIS